MYVLIRIPLLSSLTFSKFEQPEKELDDKQRTAVPHPPQFYSFSNYFAYILYPPLYIGGPIITFNDFIWQVRHILHCPQNYL